MFIFFLTATVLSQTTPCFVCAQESEETGSEEIRPSELYARFAVLMDAGTGRVLFSKSGQKPAPMASTTKIMTCILALENTDPAEEVTVSQEASSQPEVGLGMQPGQTFILEDLLYSLMLESHNDTAVSIAEHISGSVGAFQDLMNVKAEEIGCRDTYFITPNGLDAQDENGIHHTTAEDLALIMRYCITESPAKEEFLAITRTESHTFSDCQGTSTYSCTNHNAFLSMMEGALTGKTGFTNNAGYCYVGALESEGRTFIVALLACGWPNNKGYKWSDTRTLMTYAMNNWHYEEITPGQTETAAEEEAVYVTDGYTGGYPSAFPVKIKVTSAGETEKILKKNGEELRMKLALDQSVAAPVHRGDQLGVCTWTLDGTEVASYPLLAEQDVSTRTFTVCMNYVMLKYINQND